MARNYWMVVLSPENFAITRKLGFKSQGLKALHHRKVQRVGQGDRILYFLSRQRCFAATVTVSSDCVEDHNLPWEKEGSTEWAYTVDIQPDCVLAPEDYLDAYQIAPRMEYIRRWIPEEWYLAFQDHLHLLPRKDFQLLESEIRKVHGRRQRRGTPRPPMHLSAKDRQPVGSQADSGTSPP